MPRSRLKIAFVHQPWSIVRSGQCGADSVVLWTDHVARKFASSCDVICYSRHGDGLPQRECVDGVEHRRVAAPIDRYVKFALARLDRWGLREAKRPFFASKFAYRQFISQVARDLARQKPDIVHIHNFSQFVPVVRRASPGARIGLHMHCEWLTQLQRELVAQRIRHANVVIGVSDYLAAKIRARFPEFSHRIRRVHNGADVERFDRGSAAGNAPATRTVLYVGRVSPEKGIHTLLDAFAIVAQQSGDVKLRIVGPERIVPYEMIIPFCDDAKVLELAEWFRSGAYMAHLRSQVAALSRDRVDFSEREIPHDELPQIYADADLFVFPSIWDEPFGMPLVEAMAAGCAVIATHRGAFPEIVQEGTTGLLIERCDPRALADAIMKLCKDDQLRQRLGQAGRQRAHEKFSWDHVSQALMREYQEATACG